MTTSTADSKDRSGYAYQLLDLACSKQPNSALNPSDAALICASSVACEISALPTALFLTQTSTSRVITLHQSELPANTPKSITPANTAQLAKETTTATSLNVPITPTPAPNTNNAAGTTPTVRVSTATVGSTAGSGVGSFPAPASSGTQSFSTQIFTGAAAEVQAPVLWLAGIGVTISFTLVDFVML
jgi:hypothetical protein